jgi:hypothetical protein
MRKTMRKATSFTLDAETASYVRKTKGNRSASRRVDDLLKRAMLLERYEQLEEEAAAFFADEAPAERRARKAFQKAAARSLSKD